MENDLLDSEIVKLWLWLRYIDDIFSTWTEGEDKLDGFLNRLKNFHPNLEFTHEKSKSSVSMGVSIFDNKLETDLFCKPIDCRKFLRFNSAHPFHNKNNCLQPGIAYQKALFIAVNFPKTP